jgi:hypothetical protein
VCRLQEMAARNVGLLPQSPDDGHFMVATVQPSDAWDRVTFVDEVDGCHRTACRPRDSRAAMNASTVAMPRTPRRKRLWWRTSSRNVTPMPREPRTSQSPKSAGDTRPAVANGTGDEWTT